jgi:general secretion pathway protein K
MVLAVLAGLVMLVVSFAASQNSEIKEITAELEKLQAKRISESAIQRVLVEMASIDENAVLQTDTWFLLGEENGENFLVDEGSFRVQILDEGSFVNLNQANEQQLLNLGLTQEQVDSLLDWREPGFDARPEGAKDEYYNNLATPYNAALQPIRSLDELLLIKGWNQATLEELPTEESGTPPLVSGSQEARPVLSNLATVYSRAPWTGAGGQPRLNVNTANVQQISQIGIPMQLANAIVQRRNTQGTFANLGQVLLVNGVNLQNSANILNGLSVNASTEVVGRLNLNTASEAALNSLPNSSPDITTAIITRQATGFAAIGDVTSIPGVNLQWLQQNADSLVVGSRAFRVRIQSTYRGAVYSSEAQITISNGSARVTSTWESPQRSMLDRWQWVETTTGDVVLSEAP